jgi:hypothetical protein
MKFIMTLIALALMSFLNAASLKTTCPSSRVDKSKKHFPPIFNASALKKNARG